MYKIRGTMDEALRGMGIVNVTNQASRLMTTNVPRVGTPGNPMQFPITSDNIVTRSSAGGTTPWYKNPVVVVGGLLGAYLLYRLLKGGKKSPLAHAV